MAQKQKTASNEDGLVVVYNDMRVRDMEELSEMNDLKASIYFMRNIVVSVSRNGVEVDIGEMGQDEVMEAMETIQGSVPKKV